MQWRILKNYCWIRFSLISHRNPAVRTNVARLMAYVVERLGASRVLSGQKDITDRVLPAAAKLAQEGSLETRYEHTLVDCLLTVLWVAWSTGKESTTLCNVCYEKSIVQYVQFPAGNDLSPVTNKSKREAQEVGMMICCLEINPM